MLVGPLNWPSPVPVTPHVRRKTNRRGVEMGVGVGTGVRVGGASGMGVGVEGGTGLGVGMGARVAVGSGVGVGVGVEVGFGIGVGVGAGVGIDVGLVVGTGDGVVVGVGVGGTGVGVPVGFASIVARMPDSMVAPILGVGAGVGKAAFTAAATVAEISGVGSGVCVENGACVAQPVPIAIIETSNANAKEGGRWWARTAFGWVIPGVMMSIIDPRPLRTSSRLTSTRCQAALSRHCINNGDRLLAQGRRGI